MTIVDSGAPKDSDRPALPAVPGQRSRMPARPKITDHEFLPAALEVLESPPSPVRMALILTICALVCSAVSWAWFGKVDIVAVARGKIQPAGRVKVVQPLETGKVASILAQNGTRVRAGEPVIELDASEAASDLAGVSTSLMAWRRKPCGGGRRSARWRRGCRPARLSSSGRKRSRPPCATGKSAFCAATSGSLPQPWPA